MRIWPVASGVAWRTLRNIIKTPSLLLPTTLFPLFFFTAFAGGLSRVDNIPGFNFPPGYTAFQFVFVLLQAATVVAFTRFVRGRLAGIWEPALQSSAAPSNSTRSSER